MKFARLPAALAAASFVLWATLLPPATQAQVRLPALGESVSDDFGVGTERRLGDQVMREVRRDPDYLDDPVLQAYLDSIWQPLVKAARDRGEITPETDTVFAWESFLVRDKTVNAFALPGGFVGVHLGLLSMTASPDEVAAVLGHELSHVTQRHIARSMASSQRQTLVGLAALILGVLAASRSHSADAMQAVVAGSQAGMAQAQLNFSRDMEREADRVGYGVMSDAGFSPAGVSAMFEKLEHANRLNDSGNYPYLRSHPLTIERIGEARSRSSFAGSKPHPTLEHSMMQARARVLMDPSVQALRRQQGADAVAASASLSDRLQAYYGSALASTQLRDWARADQAIDKGLAALQPAPDGKAQQALQWLRVQSLIARGDGAGALHLADTLGGSAESRSALLLRSQAATAASIAKSAQWQSASRESMEALQTWVSLHPHDGTAWTQLSQNAGQLGLRLRSVRAEAEARAAVGDVGGAIDRLRAGQRFARNAAAEDFVDASIVEARLRELEHQRRQLMAEMRGERRAPSGGDEPH